MTQVNPIHSDDNVWAHDGPNPTLLAATPLLSNVQESDPPLTGRKFVCGLNYYSNPLYCIAQDNSTSISGQRESVEVSMCPLG